MSTWHDLERRFLELESTRDIERLDHQGGSAGEFWRVIGGQNLVSQNRFTAVSTIAGAKLLSEAGGELGLPATLQGAPSDDYRWYRWIASKVSHYQHGPTLKQANDDGTSGGLIFTGSMPNPAGISANRCLELAYMSNENQEPTNPITINVSGVNARLNLASIDNSKNVYSSNASTIFQEIRNEISRNIPAEAQPELMSKLDQLEGSVGTEGFMELYKNFIQIAANHMAIVAPFIPALTALLPT